MSVNCHPCRSAKAVIYKTRLVKTAAPKVAYFSSRGPQHLSVNLLKVRSSSYPSPRCSWFSLSSNADTEIPQPDISAPGVNILAAYTKFTTLTGEAGDTRVVKYNIQSGTSMACPHVSGAAAYVKSFHPDWSPSAIKSAMMTTCKKLLHLFLNITHPTPKHKSSFLCSKKIEN